MGSIFCVEALKIVLTEGNPGVSNTDQYLQFTSDAFIGVLLNKDISISMDGRGRASDNVFIERLWWRLCLRRSSPKAFFDGHGL